MWYWLTYFTIKEFTYLEQIFSDVMYMKLCICLLSIVITHNYLFSWMCIYSFDNSFLSCCACNKFWVSTQTDLVNEEERFTKRSKSRVVKSTSFEVSCSLWFTSKVLLTIETNNWYIFWRSVVCLPRGGRRVTLKLMLYQCK